MRGRPWWEDPFDFVGVVVCLAVAIGAFLLVITGCVILLHNSGLF